MTSTHRILIVAAAGLVIAAAPSAAGDWFGVSISHSGPSLGFGTSAWSLWGPAWQRTTWTGGFTTALDGYGAWVWVDGLGRVWRPWVNAGWRPFTHGRWVWTALGWTWVAYEPWGWLPHHYGNWAFTTVGWVWSPGYAYHPGNVVWLSAGSHIGWMPCAPRGWSHAHRGYHEGWLDGYAHGRLDARYSTWVQRDRMTAENLARYAVAYDVATSSSAHRGVAPLPNPPTRAQVARVTGRPVPETRVVESRVNVDGRSVRIVRPEAVNESVRRHGAGTVEVALAEPARRTVRQLETGRQHASPFSATPPRGTSIDAGSRSVDRQRFRPTVGAVRQPQADHATATQRSEARGAPQIGTVPSRPFGRPSAATRVDRTPSKGPDPSSTAAASRISPGAVAGRHQTRSIASPPPVRRSPATSVRSEREGRGKQTGEPAGKDPKSRRAPRKHGK